MSTHSLGIVDIVRKTPDLPSFAGAALEVMREANDPNCSAHTVARKLAQDQSLAARVLRLANSSFYGLSRRIADIQEAVVVLGMRSVRDLSIVAATYPWVQQSLRGKFMGPSQMWSQALGVALAGQLVAQRSACKKQEVVFTAGVLHDIGQVAMSIHLDNLSAAMLSLALRLNKSIDEVERNMLGYDHTDVGAALAEAWNLPPDLVRAIAYHHKPNLCLPHCPVVDCVHIGDHLVWRAGVGLGSEGLHSELQPEALERLGLSTSDLDDMLANFEERYQSYTGLLEAMEVAA
ncbi:MAG TPA: HDOD domain-containing protein [Fimbriimonadaceae bacterium]|nr:HDOD domain-containing protein [Fimbriimonadaceae bacterium]